jgi:TolB protein
MNTNRMPEPDFDRLLTAWFDADAQVREPEGLLDSALARTRRARRRPAWLLPEWWIPMQLTMPLRTVPRFAPLLLLIALLLAAIVAIAVVGSRPRLPAPFGPAANGQVAFLSNGQIYAANADGSNSIALTSGNRAAANPSWSRDGTRFAYKLISPNVATQGQKQHGDLVVADADGSDQITIDRDAQDMSPATWSPDGRWLVYSRFEGGLDQIYIAAADGSSPPTRLGKPDTVNWAPVFSPDGTKIMYFRGEAGVAVMNRDGSDDRLLNTSGFQRIHSAQWHPDGNRIVVSAAVTDAYDLWFLYADGTPERHLVVPGRAEVGPSWSPDGSRLVYLTSTDERSYILTVANADGATERTLPGVFSDINPSWSPDGSRIAAVNDRASVGRVSLVDPDGMAEAIEMDSLAPAQSVVADRSSPINWQRRAP